MSELLLQTIVEKLDALSAVLLKFENTDQGLAMQEALVKEFTLFQIEIKKFGENVKAVNDNISNLISGLDNHAFQAQQPVTNNVEHRHVLHKGLWAAAVLFNISMFLAIALNNSLQTQKQYEANDIKYRSLKATGDKGLLKLLFHTDSLYTIKGEAIRKMTIEEEQRLAEQAAMLRLAGEKENKAKELKKKAIKGKP